MAGIIVALVVLGLCLIWFVHFENSVLQVSHYAVNLSLRHAIKIVHLSDLHTKCFGKNNEILLRKVREQHPDLIVYTGDLIDGNGKRMEVGVSLLANLAQDIPVYFVSGNNEKEGCFETLVPLLRKQGVHVLINEIDHLSVQDNDVYLLGLDESRESHHGYGKCSTDSANYADFAPLFHELEQKDGIKLVLSHYPENYRLIGKGSFVQYHYDMLFTGHAHGGQFILPFIGAVFAPGQGFFPLYTNGLYGEKNEAKMCVSRGLGKSSFPLRLWNRPQIIDLTLL